MEEVLGLKEKMLALTSQQLDTIDMSPVYEKMKPYPEREYLMRRSGVEHYRLLYWVAQNVNGLNIVEIGSYQGMSTVCLCSNPSNEVFAYDLDFSTLHFNGGPHNLTLMQVPKEEGQEWFDKEGVLDADIIFLDSYHSGILEKKLTDYLSENKWKGVLIADDLYYGVGMNRWWNSIAIDKIELTDVGHSFGTGVIFFQ